MRVFRLGRAIWMFVGMLVDCLVSLFVGPYADIIAVRLHLYLTLLFDRRPKPDDMILILTKSII